MSASRPPRDAELNAALAYVCQKLDDLRDLLCPGGQQEEPAELRAVLAAVTASTPLDQEHLYRLLDTLHQTVQAAGDARGIWAGARTTARRLDPSSISIPGISASGITGHPQEICYTCPIGRCAGRRPDQTTIFPLICAITGRELVRERL